MTSFDAKNSSIIHAGMEAVTSSRRRSERALSTASIQENATDKELFKHTELREKVRTMTLYIICYSTVKFKRTFSPGHSPKAASTQTI